MAKQSLLSQSDSFSAAPLLSLLPVAGDIARLESYISAFYARFEQVEGLKKSEAAKDDRLFEQRCVAESGMLRAVLDWLAIKPGS